MEGTEADPDGQGMSTRIGVAVARLNFVVSAVEVVVYMAQRQWACAAVLTLGALGSAAALWLLGRRRFLAGHGVLIVTSILAVGFFDLALGPELGVSEIVYGLAVYPFVVLGGRPRALGASIVGWTACLAFCALVDAPALRIDIDPTFAPWLRVQMMLATFALFIAPLVFFDRERRRSAAMEERSRVEAVRDLAERRATLADAGAEHARLERTEAGMAEAARRAGALSVAARTREELTRTLNHVAASEAAVGLHLLAVAGRLPELAEQLRDPRSTSAAAGEYLKALADRWQGALDGARGELGVLHEAVGRAAGRIRRQQSLSRATSGARPIALREVLAAAVGDPDNVSVEVTAPPGVFRCDAGVLAEAVAVLVSNAAEATRATSRPWSPVRVCAAVDGGELCVTVEDGGRGFAGDARCFESGWTSKGRGRGFALHAAANAVASARGRLELSSPGPGCGATARLALPLAEEEVEPCAA